MATHGSFSDRLQPPSALTTKSLAAWKEHEAPTVLPQLEAMFPTRYPSRTFAPSFTGIPAGSSAAFPAYVSPGGSTSSSTSSIASPTPSTPEWHAPEPGQPVLSDDQLLQELFPQPQAMRRFQSLSMDDAVLCNQLLDLPGGFVPAEGGFLAAHIAPMAIPSPTCYSRAFSSPPTLTGRRPGVAGLAKKKPASRICRMPGCTKGIRSRGLCKAHGGGRRCQTPGCEISDQGGGHCIAHGGGRRCSVGGCQKSAQSKGLCKLHGGARLCRLQNCNKNGQIKGLCRLHYSLMMASGPAAARRV